MRLHTELTNAMTVKINLTVSYNIQYNVSIVSSLCGVTTTKVLNYGKHGILNVIMICYTTIIMWYFHIPNELNLVNCAN